MFKPANRKYKQVRYFYAITLIVLICIMAAPASMAQGRASVTISPVGDTPPSSVVLIIDGKVVEAESLQFLRGQQVMVWLRDLETLGWGKAMAGKAGEYLFKGNGVSLSFIKGEGVAKVNSLAVKLPVDTYVRDGRLMVPLAFVAKALGYNCEIAYKPVVSIKTNAPPASAPSANMIDGKVIFAGKGAAGITVRLVDKDFNVVADGITEKDGTYRFDNVPDGEFAVFVYTKDNPAYFNRVSEATILKGGNISHIKPIYMGKILGAINPKPGERVRPVDGKITLKWDKCDAAASYKVIIGKSIEQPLIEISTKEPKAQIPSSDLRRGTVYEALVSALDANGDFVGGTAGTGGQPWSFIFE